MEAMALSTLTPRTLEFPERSALSDGIGDMVREATRSSLPGVTGQYAGALYEPLQLDDSEPGIQALGFVPVGDKPYMSRELHMDTDAGPKPSTIRSDLRAGTAFLLAFGMLAGVALIGVALRQATGHPNTVDSRGTVDLLARPGEGACLPYGGHIHPNGVKCCSAKCVEGNTNYCGAANCQNQGPSGVLNCCSVSVPMCGVDQPAPCMLHAKVGQNATAITEKLTTTTTTVGVPLTAWEKMTAWVHHLNPKAKQPSSPALPPPSLTSSPPPPPSLPPAIEIHAPTAAPPTTTTTKPCREAAVRCDTNYFGITDATSQVCCDRACGKHCGTSDCVTGNGGEAMCCVLFIRSHSVSCRDAGIAPCVLEPLCPAQTATSQYHQVQLGRQLPTR